MKINKIVPLESKFTEVLEMLVLNIKMLYYYGKLPENMTFCEANNVKLKGQLDENISSGSTKRRPKVVAIVGSRKNTPYGYEVAYNAAYAAARAGAVVVSGLAYGIDSIAHRGALDAGGVTLAVLGTPIDQIYPRNHTSLAREIIEHGGAIMSEYGPGDLAGCRGELQGRFLHRNRIIAGLSDVVLVAEAAERSGSLNTATHALNFGVDLMVAPGDINRESSKGCNKLLARGALPYTGPDDLLGVLFPERQQLQRGDQSIEQRLVRLADKLETEVERRIVALLLTGVNSGEEIIQKLGLLVNEFNQQITILEIKGVVKGLGMNQWMITG